MGNPGGGWKHARLLLFDRSQVAGRTGSRAEKSCWATRERGTFEDRLADNAVRPSLSSPRFEENEATFLLALLHNLLGMARGLLEDQTENGWDAARVRDTLLKTGARIVKHSRYLLVAVARAAAPVSVPTRAFPVTAARKQDAAETQSTLGSASLSLALASRRWADCTHPRERKSDSKEKRQKHDGGFIPRGRGGEAELCPDRDYDRRRRSYNNGPHSRHSLDIVRSRE